jgi:large subunit ribosomal protein L28
MTGQMSFLRGFSTTSVTNKVWKHVVTRRVAKRPEYRIGDEAPKYIPKRQTTPDYKWGESKFFPRSNKGLFGGAFIGSGHQISEMRNKSNRFWKPNSHKKALWSETLDKSLKFEVTAKVLKTIDREGGLDNYLVKEKSARIKELGPFGWKLRYAVLKKKSELANPPHKDAKLYSVNGESGTIYYPDVQVEGTETPLNIKVGRRKLLKELYEVEKRESLALGEPLTGRNFHDKFRELSAEEIVKRLAGRGYDFGNVTVQI